MEKIELRSLNIQDLEKLKWSGGKRHINYLQEWLARTLNGDLDVVGVEKSGYIIAVCCIDYVLVKGVGTLTALSVREDLRSLGYGTKLIAECEERLKNKGLEVIELRVEISNPKAIALYKRLGFKTRGESIESWEQYDDNGAIEIYSTKALIMRKLLT